MLIDKIEKSMTQIQTHNDYEKLSLIKNNLDRLKSDIDKLNIRVEQYVSMNNILKEYIEDKNEVVFNESKYIGKQIDLILNNINNIDFNKYDSIKNIEDTVNKHYENLRLGWRETYRKDSQGAMSILLILEKLYDDSEQILKIRNKVKYIDNRWPFMDEDLERMKDGIKEANKLISKLKVSSKVQEFLQKASIGEASIIDLDDETLRWLKDNRFENKVKLSFN